MHKTLSIMALGRGREAYPVNYRGQNQLKILVVKALGFPYLIRERHLSQGAEQTGFALKMHRNRTELTNIISEEPNEV
jgi:hypothetical protein